jgi:hypothetical protein
MAPVLLSNDSLEYVRRGRVVGQAHYREAIRARARELLRAPVRRGAAAQVGGRRQVSGTAGRRTASSETVLKVISWTKSRRAPLAQARYAARTRLHDAAEASLPMINEEGRELRGAEIEAEIRSWELKPDAENLSPAARRSGTIERAAMSDRGRL